MNFNKIHENSQSVNSKTFSLRDTFLHHVRCCRDKPDEEEI